MFFASYKISLKYSIFMPLDVYHTFLQFLLDLYDVSYNIILHDILWIDHNKRPLNVEFCLDKHDVLVKFNNVQTKVLFSINVFKFISVPQKWKYCVLICFTIFQMPFRIVFMISPCWRQRWPHSNARFLTIASKGKEYGGIKERNWKNRETSNYIIWEYF